MENNITRRSLLFGFVGASLSTVLPVPMARAMAAGQVTLTAAPTEIGLLGDGFPNTPVWAYGNQVPGPELRYRQGDRLKVLFENRIAQSSTVHWHGLRVPNAMDGVPGMTQPPVPSGGTFDYQFDLPDAGTFWYHPHVKSSEQIGRGLYGALIVEEKSPPAVDRDVTWVLDDWRVDQEGRIDDNFHAMHDLSHGGRLGNLASLNGVNSDSYSVRAGERLRIRLINVANARSFALAFQGHAPQVIALDGQPVEPFLPDEGRVVLGAGQRADLIIDMIGNPGDSFAVMETYYGRSPFQFLSLTYDDQPPLREDVLNTPVRLPANPLAVPDGPASQSQALVISGGAMGGMASASYQGRTRSIGDLAQIGKVWAINGVVADTENRQPQFTFKKGTTQKLVFKNDTAWPHPMHLHGHVLQILSRNGVKVDRETWSDTLFIESGETVESLFVADNPGHWLLHCHVLEHHEAGMATSVRVI